MAYSITVRVNGATHTLEVPIRLLLVDLIRDRLGLTGTHVGCATEGRCGACTVHVDGEAVKSCLMLAVQVDGREVTTVEGLTPPGSLSQLQRCFRDAHALQCGYCTPGMLMSAAHLLDTNPAPSDQEIRAALLGNFCRCTGYINIIEAVKNAAAAS